MKTKEKYQYCRMLLTSKCIKFSPLTSKAGKKTGINYVGMDITDQLSDRWTAVVWATSTGQKYTLFKETATTRKKFYSKKQVLNYVAIAGSSNSDKREFVNAYLIARVVTLTPHTNPGVLTVLVQFECYDTVFAFSSVMTEKSNDQVLSSFIINLPVVFTLKSMTIPISYRQDIVSGGVSSFSVARVSVKREREVKSEESERVISATSVEEEGDGIINGRKKLRLTKAQSALLEQAFKHHSTLNPKQKQELARELKLMPRQVEVWFQNRRARDHEATL
ncbi:HD-ZIP protein [Artemisia annua]|uniref:HD-ZIP protein n=1 Tax=Artemisia annua TaxID=35608 RepID=A0A2U1PTB6_ARTAN|nr:HD-ZIP protein [Artemisia annua]